MQRAACPVAYLVTLGNKAATGVPEIVDALLEDPRVTAIGLHLEELADVGALSRVAQPGAAGRGAARRPQDRQLALGAKPPPATPGRWPTTDVLCDAVFTRVGIARVHRLETFVETLKLLHVHGALAGSPDHVGQLFRRRGRAARGPRGRGRGRAAAAVPGAGRPAPARCSATGS